MNKAIACLVIVAASPFIWFIFDLAQNVAK